MSAGKRTYCTLCKQGSISTTDKNGVLYYIFKLYPDLRNHYYCMPCFYHLLYQQKQNRFVKYQTTYIKYPCGCQVSEKELIQFLNYACVICGAKSYKQQYQIVFHKDGIYYCKSCQKRMEINDKTIKNLPKMKIIIEKVKKQNSQLQKQLIKKDSLKQDKSKVQQKKEKKSSTKLTQQLKFKELGSKPKEQNQKQRENPIDIDKTQKKYKKIEIQRKESNLSTKSQIQPTSLNSPKLRSVNQTAVNCFSCKQSSIYEINNKNFYFQFYKDAQGHQHCLPCLYKEYQNKQNVFRVPYQNKKITVKIMQCKCSIEISTLEQKLKNRCFICGVKQPKQKINLNSDRFYCNRCKENIFSNLLNHNMLEFILTQIQKFQKENLKQKLSEHQQIFQQPCNREEQFQSQKNQLKSSNKNTKTKLKTFAIDDQENVKRIGDVPIPKVSKHLQDLQAFLNQSQTFIQNLNNQKQTKPIYLDLSLISWNEDDPDYSQVFNLKQKPVIFQKINKVRYRCQNCKQGTDYKAFDKMCKNCFYKDIFQGTNFKFKEIQNTLSKSKSGLLQNQFENMKNDQIQMKPTGNKSEFF